MVLWLDSSTLLLSCDLHARTHAYLRWQRYVGIPYTHLENCHNAGWTACTEACPKSVAPNLITLLAMFQGFICFGLMW
jgi:hypothetical protein